MQNKLQIIMLVASVVFFLAIFGAVWFLYDLTENKYRGVEEAQARWQAEEDHRAEVKQLERMLEEKKDARAELDKHFSRSSDVVPLLDSLEEAGASVAAKAEVSSVDRIEEGKFLLVGLKVSGDWNALYKFIILLENSPYELEFTSLDIKKAFSEGGKTAWDGFLEIKVLSFLP